MSGDLGRCAMTECSDVMSSSGHATHRSSRVARGAMVHLPYGGVAIIGVIATLHRSTGTRGRNGRGASVAARAIARSGGASGPELLGTFGPRPAGAGSQRRLTHRPAPGVGH
jgi:hypothetical protein